MKSWLCTLFTVMVMAVPAAYGQEVSVTSDFGWRMHPIYGYNKFHTGVDLGYSYGTPVGTLDDGVVQLAGWYGGYGNCVIVRHDNGDSTLYGHLARVETEVGERVPAGRLIGFSGSTGVSTGPHLHLEWWHNGQYCNPLVLLQNGGHVNGSVHADTGMYVAAMETVKSQPKQDFGMISFDTPKESFKDKLPSDVLVGNGRVGIPLKKGEMPGVPRKHVKMPLQYTGDQQRQIEQAKVYQEQQFQRKDTISYDGAKGIGFNI